MQGIKCHRQRASAIPRLRGVARGRSLTRFLAGYIKRLVPPESRRCVSIRATILFSQPDFAPCPPEPDRAGTNHARVLDCGGKRQRHAAFRTHGTGERIGNHRPPASVSSLRSATAIQNRVPSRDGPDHPRSRRPFGAPISDPARFPAGFLTGRVGVRRYFPVPGSPTDPADTVALHPKAPSHTSRR